MTYALIAILWVGTAYEQTDVVRAGLTHAECRHLAAVFSVGAIVARYECRAL